MELLRGLFEFYGNENKRNISSSKEFSYQTRTRSKEYLRYPTQKPESLLERIILASSNERDIVADFFCRSGTTLVVANRLSRKWIGVDNNQKAIELCKKRLKIHYF